MAALGDENYEEGNLHLDSSDLLHGSQVGKALGPKAAPFAVAVRVSTIFVDAVWQNGVNLLCTRQ